MLPFITFIESTHGAFYKHQVLASEGNTQIGQMECAIVKIPYANVLWYYWNSKFQLIIGYWNLKNLIKGVEGQNQQKGKEKYINQLFYQDLFARENLIYH